MSRTKTRNEIATELLDGCPQESLADHTVLAERLRWSEHPDTILASPEANRWPETYTWLKNELAAERRIG